MCACVCMCVCILRQDMHVCVCMHVRVYPSPGHACACMGGWLGVFAHRCACMLAGMHACVWGGGCVRACVMCVRAYL